MTLLEKLWYSLPPEARKAYTSGANVLGELSPGAAVRDAVDASGELGRGALNLDGRQIGNALTNMGLAAVSLVPGGRLGRASTGWTFRDVKAPHKVMEPGDWREVTHATKTGEGVMNVELPIRSMNATQHSVNPDYMSPVSQNALAPFVIKKNGEYFVQDGHHRLTRAAEEGRQTSPVRLVDLDGTTQTHFPLLDLIMRGGR